MVASKVAHLVESKVAWKVFEKVEWLAVVKVVLSHHRHCRRESEKCVILTMRTC